MKRISNLLFCTILFCFGCNQTDDIDEFYLDNIEVDTTEYPFDHEIELPDGFFLDTIEVIDTLTNSYYTISYVSNASPDFDVFDQKMKKIFYKLIEYYQSYISEPESDLIDPHYTFVLGPVEFYTNGKVISVCNIIDTYSHMGNHHNYTWFTYNYDLINDCPINFKDMFNIPAQYDSLSFVELAVRNIQHDCWELDLPFDSVDFSIIKDSIKINPDLSWACGLNRSVIPIDSLNIYLKNDILSLLE